MMHVRRLSARTRFILRHGVLRWGILAGFAITIFVVHGAATGARDGDGRELLRLAILALLSFSEWSLGVGWIVGAVLWMLGRGPDARDRNRPGTRDDGRVP